MTLRWFRTYDEYGIKSEWALQYWSNKVESWIDVPFIECQEADERKSLSEPPGDETYWID